MINLIIKLIRYIRRKYWAMRFKSCGKNFLCCSGVVMHCAKNISVGDNVRIGESSYFYAKGGLNIGNNVKMGPKVFIWTSNHNYYAPKKLPYDEISFSKCVNIGDNVWIGANSSIIPRVTIGEGAVIAMGAVVTKDVPPCAVVGGNPAVVLKYRDVEKYYELKKLQESETTK